MLLIGYQQKISGLPPSVCLTPETGLSHLEIVPSEKRGLSVTANLSEADDFDLVC
jgi:hypothetical protein